MFSSNKRLHMSNFRFIQTTIQISSIWTLEKSNIHTQNGRVNRDIIDYAPLFIACIRNTEIAFCVYSTDKCFHNSSICLLIALFHETKYTLENVADSFSEINTLNSDRMRKIAFHHTIDLIHQIKQYTCHTFNLLE